MPLYDFGCEECGHSEELLLSSSGSSEIVLTCPKCGKTETETLEGLASFFASA